MKLKFLLFSSCALLFSSLSSSAQQEREVRLWLTTPDRAAIIAPQTSLHFSSDAGKLPELTVDDAQHFQTMDGFGFALTGGSAQLLMRMCPGAGVALLKQLFTTDDDEIGRYWRLKKMGRVWTSHKNNVVGSMLLSRTWSDVIPAWLS
jgi:glucosylceramidase